MRRQYYPKTEMPSANCAPQYVLLVVATSLVIMDLLPCVFTDATAAYTSPGAAYNCSYIVSFTHGVDSNPGTLTEPLKTIAKALALVQHDPSIPHEICLRSDGIHFVMNTLLVNDFHSGLTLKGYPPDVDTAGRPIVSGGFLLNKWSCQNPGGWYTHPVPTAIDRPSMLMQLQPNRILQRARLHPRGQNTDAFRARYMDDSSTFHWTDPLAPCQNDLCPDEDKLGFKFNKSDTQISSSLYASDEIQVHVPSDYNSISCVYYK